MTSKPGEQIAYMDGQAALPRKNGELVFQAPWEGRAFGMAVALNQQGLYPWNDFSERLIAEIASGEREGSPTYYEQWLAALEKLAFTKGLVTPAELEERTEEYTSGQRRDWE